MKLFSIFALLMVLFSAVVFADEAAEASTISLEVSESSDANSTEETIDEETQEELKIMTDVPGVKVRLLQLQERIERNILHGEEIIAELSSGNQSVSELEAILADLISLKEEVAAVDPEGVPVNEATAQFVALKKKAIELTKSFRDIARPLLKGEQVLRLRERFKVREAQKLSQIRTRVRTALKEHNAGIFNRLLERIGETNPELAEKIRNGELDAKEAKNLVNQKFASLSDEKKEQAKLKIKEQISKEKVKRLETIQKIKETGLENALQRIEAKLRAAENKGLFTARERIKERLEARAGEAEIEPVETREETETEGNVSTALTEKGRAGAVD